jgi:hypothetical protein
MRSAVGQRAGWRPWARFAMAIAALWLLLFVIGPRGLASGPLEPMARFIEERGIEANAYFYTEVEEFAVAERHMREHLALVPGCASRGELRSPDQ